MFRQRHRYRIVIAEIDQIGNLFFSFAGSISATEYIRNNWSNIRIFSLASKVEAIFK